MIVKKLGCSWLIMVLVVGMPFVAAGGTLKKVMVHGTPVEVFGESGAIVVAVGDRIVIHDENAESASIEGIYEGGGRTYVLVDEYPGGNFCDGDYHQAIDLSGKTPKVSKQFGDCDPLKNSTVSQGILKVTFDRLDGKGSDIYTYYNGVFTKREKLVSLEPTGPTTAPGGDLAAFAAAHSISDLFMLRASVVPLMRILPKKAFSEARDLALSGLTSEATVHGEAVFLSACQPHNCASHQVVVAFDHAGRAWASLLQDHWTASGQQLQEDTLTVYGDPPPDIRLWLDPRRWQPAPDGTPSEP